MIAVEQRLNAATSGAGTVAVALCGTDQHIIQCHYEIGSPWGLDAWVIMPPLYNPAWSWGRRPGA
jgi:hypothetical protein